MSSPEQGFIEAQMHREQRLVGDLERTMTDRERRAVARSCEILISHIVHEELPEAVEVILGQIRRAHERKLREPLSQRDFDETRGVLDGLDLAGKGLTDCETLSTLRREMLGITDDPGPGA